MEESLKEKAFIGVSWSVIEKFSVQGTNFLLQIILARLLMPADFGLIAIILVFIQISQVIIDSGFASALIQKKKCIEEDYTTVFYCNLIISLVIYFILFFTAPLIAKIYNEVELISLLRVISVSLLFNALSIVQRTKLVKNVDFKSISIYSFLSSVSSGGISIVAAYSGAGVWALVLQVLLNSLFLFLLFWIKTKWIPSFSFSIRSFNSLFKFGSNLLLTNLLNTLYRNLYSMIIGKKYNSADLGCYSRADQFAMFPSNNLSLIILRVAYPVLSRIQDDDKRLRGAYVELLKYSSFIIFPLMLGLAAVAEPFIIAILTEKWIFVVPLLQILCFDWMFDHMSAINLNVLYVKNHTGWALNIEIIKKIIAILILIITIPFGVVVMCWGRVLYSIFAVIINGYFTNKLIGLSLFSQILDILPYFVGSLCMAGLVLVINTLDFSPIIQLSVSFIVGVSFYSLLSFLFFRPILLSLYKFYFLRK
ncbi:lipopolysaccharide biosynthesis protein [Bacteroides bouchesdurhonensis]